MKVLLEEIGVAEDYIYATTLGLSQNFTVENNL